MVPWKGPPLRVLVIRDATSSRQIFLDLSAHLAETDRVVLVDGCTEEASDCTDQADQADRVLVLLTNGVLAKGSASRAQLSRVTSMHDEHSAGAAGPEPEDERSASLESLGHVVYVYDEGNWQFNRTDKGLEPGIRASLEDNEALVWRPLSPGGVHGRGYHEFVAMVHELLMRLGALVEAKASTGLAKAAAATPAGKIPAGGGISLPLRSGAVMSGFLRLRVPSQKRWRLFFFLLDATWFWWGEQRETRRGRGKSRRSMRTRDLVRAQ